MFREYLQQVNDFAERVTGRRFSRVLTADEERIRHLSLMFHSLQKFRGNTCRDEDLLFLKWIYDHIDDSHAQLFQDLWVLFELDAESKGRVHSDKRYFVEFGALDGCTLSNTLLLERSYGWSGLLIEPNPYMQESLRSSRNCSIDARMVHSCSGETKTLIIPKESEFAAMEGFEDLDMHRNKRKISEKVEVESVTLMDVLDEHNAPAHIDFLSVDTEGSELQILRSYDWSRTIGHICVEHNYGKNRSQIAELLVSRGYTEKFPAASFFDSWWVYRSAP